MLDEYLLIGKVLRPQGIKGQVKVEPITDDPERFTVLETVFLEKNGVYEPVPVKDVSVRADGVYLSLNGACDRNTAEKQRGLLLYIDRQNAVELAENENFICDLIGCIVVDRQGNTVGRVKDVLQPGANDVYVIDTGKGVWLAPALLKAFPEVNVAEKRILCDERILPQVWVESDE